MEFGILLWILFRKAPAIACFLSREPVKKVVKLFLCISPLRRHHSFRIRISQFPVAFYGF